MSDIINDNNLDDALEAEYIETESGIVLSTGDGNNYTYKRPTCTLKMLIEEYIIGYSCTTIKRTAPYGGSAPIGITKMLQAIVVACNKDKKEDFIRCGVVKGYLEKDYKVNMGTHENLCRLSAQPFPLIQSGKIVNVVSGELDPVPLYDDATGQFAAERYSNVRLSQLGKIAFKDSANIPVSKIKYHKGIVPIALLRKGLSWALGHHSTMYSLNPKEIFQLQERMLELNTMMLPTEIVTDIFRGPDLGRNYTVYMTNDSLASLYASGVGSMMVVPDIEIDRHNSQIIFKRPPLDTIGTEFASYLTRRLRGGTFKNKDGKEVTYEKFETLDLDLKGQGAFISGTSIVADVVFLTNNDQEIIDELHSDSSIYQNIPLQNILLRTQEGAFLQTDEEDLDSTADFDIDVVPIFEILWEHIEQEIEIRKAKYITEYNEKKAKLKWDLFLEKVTRPEISSKILEVWSETNTKGAKYLRRNRLEELFLNEETRDKNLLPEGFDVDEIREIIRESASNSATGLQIISAMADREKYENIWHDTLQRIEELEHIIMDEQNTYIREEIRKSLSSYSRISEFERKSQVYFVEPIGTNDEELNTVMIPRDTVWKEHFLPCTVYYNDRKMVKSYGRNVNIIPAEEDDEPENFIASLNCTTYDYVAVFGTTPGKVEVYKVSDIPCEVITSPFEIKAIIPYPKPGEKIMLNILESMYESRSYIPKDSKLYIMDGDNPILPTLSKFENIVSYAYLDKQYVQMTLLTKGEDSAMSVVAYETQEILNNASLNEMISRSQRHIIADICSKDSQPLMYNLLNNNQSDTAVVLDSLKSWEDLNSEYIDPLYLNITSTTFLDHIEYYIGDIFIPWWSESHLVTIQANPHSKHLVVPEIHWCRPKDLTSRKFKTAITTKLRKSSRGVRCVITNASKSYQDYSISQLDDWSLIDPRYRMPIQRPTDDTSLVEFNEFFRRLNTCQVSDTQYKSMDEKIKEFRTVGVSVNEEEDGVDESLDKSMKNISSGILTEDLDDSDDIIGLDD